MIAITHEYVIPVFNDKVCSSMKFVVPMNIQWSPIIISVPFDKLRITRLATLSRDLHRNRVPYVAVMITMYKTIILYKILSEPIFTIDA